MATEQVSDSGGADGRTAEFVAEWRNAAYNCYSSGHKFCREVCPVMQVTRDEAYTPTAFHANVVAMEQGNLPVRVICPGRVYRNETISARAHCFFHQCEGLYVDKDVSFADLKQTLYYFVTEMFGENTKVRFRPSYFPFTDHVETLLVLSRRDCREGVRVGCDGHARRRAPWCPASAAGRGWRPRRP